MPKLQYISLKKLFKIERGNSLYTKNYCQNNVGIYPVYSANNNKAFASINHYDYDGKYLTLSIGGIAGIVTILNCKFSCNCSRAILKPIVDNIDIEYIKYIAQPLFRRSARGRRGANGENEFTNLSNSILEKIEIPIPIKEDGEYDLEAQIAIANKYEVVDVKKRSLLEDKKKLLNTSIDIDLSQYAYINKEVQDIIDLSKSSTNSSKFTLEFIQRNPGKIPVYGAAKFADKVGYGYIKDNAEIKEPPVLA